MRKDNNINKLLIYIMLFIGCSIFIFPLVWMVLTSIKARTDLFVIPTVWLSIPPQWSNYVEAFNRIPFLLQLKNTLYICIMSMIGVIFSGSLVAYGLSRIIWPGRNILFIIILATMMLPYQATMIPVFILFRHMKLVNTPYPMIIIFWVGPGFYVFLMRQFFLTIPMELSDAAKIDGCSEFMIYRKIILPISKPVLFTAGLFIFFDRWNEFIGPLIFLNSEEKYTLSLGLRSFILTWGAEWTLLMAISTVIVIPIAILFFFTQRTFVQGISTTGLKS